MDYLLTEWLHIIVRWVHVISGIMWIGQTYLFNWLERHLPDALSADAKPNVAGHIWMVHGGGFYYLEKQSRPEKMPGKLHWFKYESLLTWVTGVVLLALVYYLGGALIDPTSSKLSVGQATALSVGLLIAGWVLYDLLLTYTPLRKSDTAAGFVFLPIIVGLSWFLTHTFTGRAAYIQLGAMFGTIMVANVWRRILPGQSRMVEAVTEGREPDMSFGALGKQRSKHNSFLSVPLIFIMISNHFPVATYGSEHNWIILPGLVVGGWVAAKFIRDH